MNMAKCHNLKQSHEMPQMLKLQKTFGQTFKGVFLGILKHAPSQQCLTNYFSQMSFGRMTLGQMLQH
jgi:hypothetical protein